jgi:hypothetical protein
MIPFYATIMEFGLCILDWKPQLKFEFEIANLKNKKYEWTKENKKKKKVLCSWADFSPSLGPSRPIDPLQPIPAPRLWLVRPAPRVFSHLLRCSTECRGRRRNPRDDFAVSRAMPADACPSRPSMRLYNPEPLAVFITSKHQEARARAGRQTKRKKWTPPRNLAWDVVRASGTRPGWSAVRMDGVAGTLKHMEPGVSRNSSSVYYTAPKSTLRRGQGLWLDDSWFVTQPLVCNVARSMFP